MSYGLLVYDFSGNLNFSLKGQTPRFHSSGVFTVPGGGNGVIGARVVYTVNISVPEITDPSLWWVVDIPMTSPAYEYSYNEIFRVTITAGNIEIIVRINDTRFNMPFKYVLMVMR